MAGFIVRLAISALGLALASALVSGVHIEGTGNLVLAAFLLGFVNAIVRPLFIVLTLPITVVTLGLFLLIVNGLMLWLVAWLPPAFTIDGFSSAFLGALVVGITGWFGSWAIGPKGRVEMMVVKQRSR